MKINFKTKENHKKFIEDYLKSLGYESLKGTYTDPAIKGPYRIFKHSKEKIKRYDRVCLSDQEVYTTDMGALSVFSDLDTIKDHLSKENLNIPL